MSQSMAFGPRMWIDSWLGPKPIIGKKLYIYDTQNNVMSKVFEDRNTLRKAALAEVANGLNGLNKEWSLTTSSHAFCQGPMDALGACLQTQKIIYII